LFQSSLLLGLIDWSDLATRRSPPQPSKPSHTTTPTKAIILPLALHVAHTFLAISAPLKRLESAARSPVYAHFTESITGLVVLRAYHLEAHFLQRLHDDVDRADETHFVLWIANYYMSMRLRLLGATVAGATALAVVLRVGGGERRGWKGR
jgi:ABC-type multidrug transport system fused ATPase/permease subunit